MRYKVFISPRLAPKLLSETPWLRPEDATADAVVNYLTRIIARDNLEASLSDGKELEYDFSVIGNRFLFLTRPLVSTYPAPVAGAPTPVEQTHTFKLTTDQIEAGIMVENLVRKVGLSDTNVLSGEYYVLITSKEGGDKAGWYAWFRNWGWMRCRAPLEDAEYWKPQIRWKSNSGVPHIMRFVSRQSWLGNDILTRITYLREADELFWDGDIYYHEKMGDWKFVKGWTKNAPWYWEELWKDEDYYDKLAAEQAKARAAAEQEAEEAAVIDNPIAPAMEQTIATAEPEPEIAIAETPKPEGPKPVEVQKPKASPKVEHPASRPAPSRITKPEPPSAPVAGLDDGPDF